mmetsp:Transcript_18945/g.29715  ORF Transcript_18945/g.29715 Transcript_18945/m.29715 type:complete len:93 (+) Transcript_18945:31-309(+)
MRRSAAFVLTRKLLNQQSEDSGKVLLKDLSLAQLLKEPLKHNSVVPEYNSQDDIPRSLREYSPEVNAEALQFLKSTGNKGRAKKSAARRKEA